MAEPVLVVHGVGNRIQSDFEEEVRQLNNDVGNEWSFIPVFWGNLGAEVLGLNDTLPELAPVVRSGADGADVDPILVEALLGAGGGGQVVRADDAKQEIVASAAAEAMGRSAEDEIVRSGDDPRAAVRDAIAEEWGNTRWLKLVQNEEILAAVGRTIGVAAQQQSDEAAGGFVTRGEETRGIVSDVKGMARSVLGEIDKTIGAIVGAAAGSLNQNLRSAFLDEAVMFIGDVFVYRRLSKEIHELLWAAIQRNAPGYGTQEKPIYVVAHSLGGVISFDAATAAPRQLWIKAFVTFGSQAPFFHVIDPHVPPLERYQAGRPVKLPASIGRWTNLWQPLDPLAFIAAKVFRLHNGEPPRDIEVPHLATSGIFTHGVYWHHPRVVAAIRETLV